jgi:ComF family protein
MVFKKEIWNVIKGSMEKLLTNIFDFFLPRICPCCKTKLFASEECICLNCLKNIKIAENDLLRIEYQRDFKPKGFINNFTSAFIFEKDKELQTLVHELKYNKRFLNGVFLGEQIAELRKDKIKKWEIDVIIPIPLHSLKLAERGFNQAYYISKGLSKKLNIPMKNKIIKRKKFTQSQTKLTRKEREANLTGAFELLNSKIVDKKNVLIIDDVITTGATTNECAKVLLSAGVRKVHAASVAIAEFKSE